MKVFYGFVAGIDFAAMLDRADQGKAWPAVAFCLLTVLFLCLARKEAA